MLWSTFQPCSKEQKQMPFKGLKYNGTLRKIIQNVHHKESEILASFSLVDYVKMNFTETFLYWKLAETFKNFHLLGHHKNKFYAEVVSVSLIFIILRVEQRRSK